IIGVVVSSIFYNSNSENTSNNTVGANSNILRIGYFANLNHAQAVIGLNDGDFENTFTKNGITVQPIVFNAGPSAIEALFASQIDVAYVGPNPAINGYLVSEGRDLRIISGASSGGAVFVVRNDSGIKSAKDFAGKKFASPQVGNTQDIALRSYLLKNGYKTKENGGNVEVISTNLADIITLFLKKQLDGAWVPEPWGARLVKEANGKTFLDERSLWPNGKFVTANIIVRTDYLKNNPETIKKLLALHINETLWINSHKNNAIQLFDNGLKKLTDKTIPEDELKQALSRIDFTYDPIKNSLFKSARDAYNLGFLAKGQKQQPDLSGIYDLTLLNNILKEKGLHEVL
ncbi:MAG TPA: ABC transporter substrate-binding protein, partial [Nitrososphaeraceae archaeon]